MTYKNKSMTPKKKKFAEVVALTDNATEAVRQAYPELKGSSTSYLTTKAHRLMTNEDIKLEISNRKQQIARLADKAVAVFERNMEHEDARIAQRAAEFVYEQEEGKAVMKVESSSTALEVHINLSGD